MRNFFVTALFSYIFLCPAYAQEPTLSQNDKDTIDLSLHTKHQLGLYYDPSQGPIVKPWIDDGRVDWKLPGLSLDSIIQFSFKPLSVRYRFVSTIFVVLDDGRKKELETTDKYEHWKDARMLGSAGPIFNEIPFWKKETYKVSWYEELTDPNKPAVDQVWTDAIKDCTISNRVENLKKKSKTECLRLLRAIQFEVTRVPTVKPSYLTIYIDPNAPWPQPATPTVAPMKKERKDSMKEIDGLIPPPPPTLEFATPTAPKTLVENPGSTLKEPPPLPKK